MKVVIFLALFCSYRYGFHVSKSEGTSRIIVVRAFVNCFLTDYKGTITTTGVEEVRWLSPPGHTGLLTIMSNPSHSETKGEISGHVLAAICDKQSEQKGLPSSPST